MADAKKCDRCGSFFLIEEIGNYAYSNAATNSKIMVKPYSDMGSVEYDLCESCMQKFRNFMNEGKN